MADVQLTAVISAKDEASAKINKFAAGLGGVVKSLGVMAVAGAAAGLAVAGVFAKKSIDAAKVAEVQMARVDAILKTLKGSLEDNKRATEDAAKAALRLGFDDEDAAVSMARLLQVSKDQTTAFAAQQAAMDLARFSGQDLETTTRLLTLAMQGNGRILKQLNIDVPDNASQLEVLGLVQDKVKGQAEAFGNTFAGAQAKIAVQIENVQEKFGAALIKGLTPFVTKLSDWISDPRNQEFIQGVANKVGNLATALVNLSVSVLPKALEWLHDLAGGWRELNKTVDDTLKGLQAIQRFLTIDTKNNFENPFSRIGDYLGGLKGKAGGGYVSGGTPYMVGERGPELFVPGQSGNIVPNGRIGGGITINVTGNTISSQGHIDTIVSEIKRVLNREQVLAQLRV